MYRFEKVKVQRLLREGGKAVEFFSGSTYKEASKEISGGEKFSKLRRVEYQTGSLVVLPPELNSTRTDHHGLLTLWTVYKAYNVLFAISIFRIIVK